MRLSERECMHMDECRRAVVYQYASLTYTTSSYCAVKSVRLSLCFSRVDSLCYVGTYRVT